MSILQTILTLAALPAHQTRFLQITDCPLDGHSWPSPTAHREAETAKAHRG